MITVSELTRRFGTRTALASVSVSMPRGAVYGLVGANGAGKTTLIRHILGLLRAESGTVRVFGLDPVADPVAVLSRIGYLSEENDLPGWMRVDELIRYSRAFYPAWDDAYAEELRRAFALDPAAKIRTLSKGQKARAGRLFHSRVLSDRTLVLGAGVWLGAVLALHGLLVWLVSTPLLARYFLALIAILAIPLARLSAAPLALARNRHR